MLSWRSLGRRRPRGNDTTGVGDGFSGPPLRDRLRRPRHAARLRDDRSSTASSHESWLRSLYRSVVTTSLTGLDIEPARDRRRSSSRWCSSSAAWHSSPTSPARSPRRCSAASSPAPGPRSEGGGRSSRMRDHYIICGYGRVGRRVAAEFREAGVHLRRARLQRRRARGGARGAATLFIEGNGTDDDDLRGGRARPRARARRRLRLRRRQPLHRRSRRARPGPNLLIVARASTEDAARKLKLAGADRIVQPYQTAGPRDGEPRAEAAGDRLPRRRDDRRRPRPPLRGDRGHARRPARPGKTIRDLRIRAGDGRARRRDPQAGRRRSTRRRSPTRSSTTGDVVIAAGTLDELRALEDALRPATRPLPASAARAPRRGSSREARRRRPRARAARRTPTHGDYATNVALRLAPARGGGRRASSREELAGGGAGAAPASSAPRSRARASSTSGSRTSGSATALAEMLDAGPGYGGGSAEPPERVQVEMVSANPTGPVTVASARNGAYGDASRGCSSTPGTRSSASTTTTTRARRWTASAPRSRRCGAGRSRRRTATAASTSREPRGGRRATRCRRCSSGSRRRSSASASTSTRGRSRATLEQRLPDVLAGRRHVRAGRRGLGPLVRVRRRRRPRARSARRAAAPTYRAADIVYLVTSSSAGSTARSTCSAPTTTARATGTRRSPGCSATTPRASRCCSTSSST